MNLNYVLMTSLAVLIVPSLAVAQGDPMAMAHQMAANQLGLLEYCQGQGAVDDAPLTAQKTVMAQLPASAAPTDAAEALGKQGTFSANGSTMSMASMAGSHNVTVESLCKQMGSAVIQTVAMLKQQQGSMPSMPGGMPAMPAMPGGMPSMTGMPSMGSMPGMPGTAPAR